jgi:zinc protease
MIRLSGIVLAAAACSALACAHGGPAQSGSATLEGEAALASRPRIEPLGAFAAPVPRLHTFANGLKLFVIEKPGDGIEALQLIVKRGSADDPRQLPGLATLALEMLDAGAAGRSQTEMAAAADAIGASIRAGAGSDGSVISGSAMTSRAEALVALFADVALRPNFDEAEWARLLGQRQADLQAARAEPRVAASRAFGRAVYGEHPYGQPGEGTVESVKAMKLADAKAFYSSFRPAQAALVAVGGAPEAQIVELLRKAFEPWTGPAGGQEKVEPPQARPAPAERPRLVVVDFPGKPQTVMRVGEPGVPRSSPDVLALRLWNSVVGGSFTSRLMQNLREKHGYTYGAGSGFAFAVGPGPFSASADVKTEVTAEALRELLSEVERALDAPISAEELGKAKSLLAFDLVQALEHADGAAAAFGQLFLYDLPLDEFQTFVPRLGKLTAQDVQAAARRALQTQQMTIVLVGDKKQIEAQLATSGLQLPAAQVRDVVGELAASR